MNVLHLFSGLADSCKWGFFFPNLKCGLSEFTTLRCGRRWLQVTLAKWLNTVTDLTPSSKICFHSSTFPGIGSSLVLQRSPNPRLRILCCPCRLNTTVAPLFYADQFLQMSTSLASRFIYGLAEHRATFLQDVHWNTLSLWARDEPPTVRANHCAPDQRPPPATLLAGAFRPLCSKSSVLCPVDSHRAIFSSEWSSCSLAGPQQ